MYNKQNMRITASDLNKNIDKYILIDIREKYEREADGHIPNDIHYPMSTIGDDFIELLKKQTAENFVVIYCHSSNRSSKLLIELDKITDTSKIYDLIGGYSIYKGSGYITDK